MQEVYVLSEMVLKEGCMGTYLEIAAGLKAELAKMEGFIRSERFESLATENKLLSLSVWESEAAVEKWRNLFEHRQGQAKARAELFESYKITVTTAIRSYTGADRTNAPADSNDFFKV